MIYTSCHKNYQLTHYNTYAISGNRGKDANYKGKCYPKLAPKLQFWKIWHDNIGVISEDENNKFYIREYYEQVLSKLNPWQIYKELDRGVIPEEEEDKFDIKGYYEQLHKLDLEQYYREIGNSILLCYEDNTEFCHRHIIAAWFELLLDKKVPEIKINGSCVEIVDRPAYIKEYLEEIIKQNINMRGFSSVRAAYLTEEANKFIATAKKLAETQPRKSYEYFEKEAYFLICEAVEAEKKSKQQKSIKIKTRS